MSMRLTRGLLSPVKTTLQRQAKSAMTAPAPEPSTVLEASLPDGLGTLFVGLSGGEVALSPQRPGNGGFRLLHYSTLDEARKEAIALADTMEQKHAAYRTGFAGAKLVCAAGKDIDPRALTIEQKNTLLDATAQLLREHQGGLYTGCDMNTTEADMKLLSERTDGKYVLAALPNEAVDASAVTAHGVVGALTYKGDVAGQRFLVHGCGGVGRVVAEELVKAGAEVMTWDIIESRADMTGCINISSDQEWWTREVDTIVPCSASGVFTEDRIKDLHPRCKAIIGSTNLPFATDQALDAAVERNVLFVPECITSAGAIIADSIEHFDQHAFEAAEPETVYAFARHAVAEKTKDLINAAHGLKIAPSHPDALEAVSSEARGDVQLGLQFREQAKELNKGLGLAQIPERHMHTPAEDPLEMEVPRWAGRGSPIVRMQEEGRRATTQRRAYSTKGATEEPSDVVIVGAGIMGLNIAYQLKRRHPSMRVKILERQAGLGHGSSGYSTGFLRAFYSFDPTMQLALDGIAAYKNWRDYLCFSADEPCEMSGFTQTHALWMLGKTKCANEEIAKRLAKFGVESEVMDKARLQQVFPMMNFDPYPKFDDDGNEVDQNLNELSALHEIGCGHVDSSACLQDLLRAVRRDGVDVRFNCKIDGFVKSADGTRCIGARGNGVVHEAGLGVVNGAGPWFNALMKDAGVTLSTNAVATRIQVAHKHISGEEHLGLPFVADGWGDSGIYFMPRRGNNQLVFGSVAHRFESETLEDPDTCNPALDPDFKQDYLNCLFHRLPTLDTAGDVHGFSSMYTVNTDDVHPMIGETSLKGLWACNGFSGHGFKLAPAVGSLVSQQLTGQKTNQWETDIPHDFMSCSRKPLKLQQMTHFA